MNYVFIIQTTQLGSAVMRGVAVTRALQLAGVDAQCITNNKLHKARIGPDTVAFIVKQPHPETIKHLRAKKATVVFDPVDTDVWSHLGLGYDIVLANHARHAKHISTVFKGPVVIVPHLHTNTERCRKDVQEVKTLGYVGLPHQFSITEDMERYCGERGFLWRQSRSEDTQTVHEMTMAIDLGVIYLDKSLERQGFSFHHAIKYKPATKLINMLSFGIPCLFTPTVAFMEVVSLDPTLRFLVVNSVDQLYEKIDTLISDKALYRDMAIRGAAVSERFHMDRAKELYVDQLSQHMAGL